MEYEKLKVAVGSGYGYCSAINFLKRLAQSDQDAYIINQNNDCILMSDETEYKVVSLTDSIISRGRRFHQLILESNYYDSVYIDFYEEIQNFKNYNLCCSCVPDKIQYGGEI